VGTLDRQVPQDASKGRGRHPLDGGGPGSSPDLVTRDEVAGVGPAPIDRQERVVGGGRDGLAVDGQGGDAIVGMGQDGRDCPLDDGP
jgi:hypothetical protein